MLVHTRGTESLQSARAATSEGSALRKGSQQLTGVGKMIAPRVGNLPSLTWLCALQSGRTEDGH